MKINLDGDFRKYVVTGVASSILGPKFGINEVLHETINPCKLYLTGVLSPLEEKIDLDASRSEMDPEVEQGEQDETGSKVDNPFKKEPGLSSSSQPRSMGISFLLETSEKCPRIDVCLTWASYQWINDWRDVKDDFDFKKYKDFINKELKEKIWYKRASKHKDEVEGEELTDENVDKGKELTDEDKNVEERLRDEDVNEEKDMEPYGAWKRIPKYLLLKNFKLCQEYSDNHYFSISHKNLNSGKKTGHFTDFEGNLEAGDENKSAIKFRIKKIGDKYKITIFFLNIAKFFGYDEKNRGKWVESFIFQPQIRVKCRENTFVSSYEKFDPEKSKQINEENNLRLQYFNSRQKCRGHMCSALWKKIDPEREEKDNNSNFSSKMRADLDGPPFYWVDGGLLKFKDRKHFTCPDVRSEFIPIYSVSTPDFSLREITGKNDDQIKWTPIENHKILDPEELAKNCLNRKKLKTILSYLPIQYEKWIKFSTEIINQVIKTDPDRKWGVKIATQNLKKHKEVLNLIKDGIELLVKPENINLRLSFGFANKAIALQNSWDKKSETFHWRIFQLAFLLMSIKPIFNKSAPERDIIDLIWIPTGGGKTEAYLFLAAFAFGYRRRLANLSMGDKQDSLENGTYLISRYTLRLLTIQQFRRATKLITACEILRLKGLDTKSDFEKDVIGWLPDSIDKKLKEELISYEAKNVNWLWGTTRFSIGLWVGGTLTPNKLITIPPRGDRDFIYGADLALKVRNDEFYKYRKNADEVTKMVGDPAQITKCPVCGATLSFPKLKGQTLPIKSDLYLLIYKRDTNKSKLNNKVNQIVNNVINNNIGHRLNFEHITQNGLNLDFCEAWKNDDLYIFQFNIITNPKVDVECRELVDIWETAFKKEIDDIYLVCTHILNPGYFYKGIGNQIDYTDNIHKTKREDFFIRCCNPKCGLNKSFWMENKNIAPLNPRKKWEEVETPWKIKDILSKGIPINAFTVDQQVYKNFPTLVIGTVDKFVQLTYKDSAGTIFGNLRNLNINFTLVPPEIILQDELHLIKGPLGSMVGIYEVLIDELCKRYDDKGNVLHKPKYIASTATIRSGKTQAKSLYSRKMRIFPPYGLSQKDSFFLVNQDLDQIIEKNSGRLYMGLCCPGKSKIAPQIHLWAELFQIPHVIRKRIKDPSNGLSSPKKEDLIKNLDPFWTIVEYFNAIKELAKTRSVYTQEFISWMKLLFGNDIREILRKNEPIELSSRTDSVLLPNFFEELEQNLDLDYIPVNGVLTTSMFGTGVDVSRLGVMIVNGQPKTHSSYIQATGRIGRKWGGIVCTFYHSFRPRDLNHYELFGTYHTQLYKNVEPISVTPFAPECISQTIGGITVGFLRQARRIRNLEVSSNWVPNDTGPQEIINLNIPPKTDDLIKEILEIINKRKSNQPSGRLFDINDQIDVFLENLEYWQKESGFQYKEYCFKNEIPSKSVVCGDPRHKAAQNVKNDIKIVFDNVPNSLRGVEKTTTFGLWIDR